MSYQRTVSGASTLTILSDDFVKRVLEDVDNASLATKDLVRKAKSYIGSLSNINVIEGMGEAAPILRAMIDHAPCERGQRYAACAIICCDNEKLQLVNVANDWVKFLLLPCSYIFLSQMHQLPQLDLVALAYKNPTPRSDYSTPTLDDTQQSMTTVKQNRPSSFRELLDKRQARKCAVIEADPTKIIVEGAHIIKRSLAKEDGSETGITHSLSIPPTWDIIRQYANISVDDLENSLDSPENGILLQIEMHRAFERFKWCLVATEQQDEYTVKWFGEDLFIFSIIGRKVVNFQNQSSEPTIPLPKPEYIALHAAIAHILHETKLV